MSTEGVVLLAVAVGGVAGSLYTFAVYPALVALVARARPRTWLTGEDTPRVALVVSAFNEERVMREKLLNALALDYPSESLEIWVSSDGSTDSTNDIVLEFGRTDPRVHLCAYAENRGKTAALMDTLAAVPGNVPIIVFSDANAMLDPLAVRALTKHFADQGVGAVAGELRYLGQSAEAVYRRYENWIKRSESAVRSCLVAEGSIFAARRHLIPRLNDWQLEDLSIPLAVTLAGLAVVYEPEAISEERFELQVVNQFRRRRRIVNRAVRSALAARAIFNPFATGMASWMFISHRVMRWLTPVMLLAAATAGLALSAEASVQWTAIGAGAVCVGGLLLAVASRRYRGLGRLTRLPVGFAVANAALLAGLAMVITGRRTVRWNPSR